MRMLRKSFGLRLVALSLACLACSEPEAAFDLSKGEAESETAVEVAPEERIEVVAEVGPVKARVLVSPKEPRLGDRIALTLEVEAAAGVEVLMPVDGEALGRFKIGDYRSGEEQTAAGGIKAFQRYALETPMSGTYPIPSLLVEFVDRRPGQVSPELQELLTPEIPLVIASVRDEAAGDTLRPARASLDPLPIETVAGEGWMGWWIGLALALLVLGVVLLLVLRRIREIRSRRSAFDVAWSGLLALESEGLPEADVVDSWYVRLSGIVRRYLEDHFGLRAPELTTEEFLNVAQGSELLEKEHRTLLQALLEQSDQVKFSAYVPAFEESQEALEAARRFLSETRAREEAQPA